MITEISVAVIGAIAAISVSIIGFIVAVTSAVIAKEQKVSEFRQKWIDELRSDISEFTSISLQCAGTAEQFRQMSSKNPDSYDDLADLALKLVTTSGDSISIGTKVKLRLNKNEHEKVIGLIDSINSLSSYDDDSFNRYSKMLFEFQDLSHDILKNEWERVKVGEKRFVRFRSFGELCLFAFITAFFILLAAVKFPEYFLTL